MNGALERVGFGLFHSATLGVCCPKCFLRVRVRARCRGRRRRRRSVHGQRLRTYVSLGNSFRNGEDLVGFRIDVLPILFVEHAETYRLLNG